MDQPLVVGDRDGLPAYFHRNEALGNAVVPAVAEYIGRLLMEADK